MAIILKNIEWDTDKDTDTLEDFYEIEDIEDLNDYLDGNFWDYDGIIDYVSDKTGWCIKSCEIMAEIAVDFEYAVEAGCFDNKKSEELHSMMYDSEIYEYLDNAGVAGITVPLAQLLEYFEENCSYLNENNENDFCLWYDNYTPDEVNGIFEFMEKEAAITGLDFDYKAMPDDETKGIFENVYSDTRHEYNRLLKGEER